MLIAMLADIVVALEHVDSFPDSRSPSSYMDVDWFSASMFSYVYVVVQVTSGVLFPLAMQLKQKATQVPKPEALARQL